jgi:hypothetical protein
MTPRVEELRVLARQNFVAVAYLGPSRRDSEPQAATAA